MNILSSVPELEERCFTSIFASVVSLCYKLRLQELCTSFILISLLSSCTTMHDEMPSISEKQRPGRRLKPNS
jgi:hypothetical protein